MLSPPASLHAPKGSRFPGMPERALVSLPRSWDHREQPFGDLEKRIRFLMLGAKLWLEVDPLRGFDALLLLNLLIVAFAPCEAPEVAAPGLCL